MGCPFLWASGIGDAGYILDSASVSCALCQQPLTLTPCPGHNHIRIRLPCFSGLCLFFRRCYQTWGSGFFFHQAPALCSPARSLLLSRSPQCEGSPLAFNSAFSLHPLRPQELGNFLHPTTGVKTVHQIKFTSLPFSTRIGYPVFARKHTTRQSVPTLILHYCFPQILPNFCWIWDLTL